MNKWISQFSLIREGIYAEKYLAVNYKMARKNLLWLVKSFKHQHDSRIKAAITSGER